MIDVLTLGEALVAMVPDRPEPLETAQGLRMFVGGAEVNFAVGTARLGVPTAWLGRLGDDPPGRRVLHDLVQAGVDTRWVIQDPFHPTGLYLREWLADGVRRPYYYRAGSAATHATAGDWPYPSPAIRWLHVTGITSALGAGPAELVRHAIAAARACGATISLDPNYRPKLWPPDKARATLRPLAGLCDLLLLSAEDAEVLYGTAVAGPDLAAATRSGAGDGPRMIVLKLGADGAATYDGERWQHEPVTPVGDACDPVGAGDAFDAGLVAALLNGAPVSDAVRLGCHIAARAVTTVGEHSGLPTAGQLPPDLRKLLAGK